MTRNWWIDNLRSFITLLVVAHHSTLSYTTFAWFNKDAYITSTHPIVDTTRWRGLDIFVNFNDIFFMSLMFLISGIFVVSSLQHKSISTFIRDRFYRLFIPFMVGVTLLMLLAYYPAYYIAHGKHDIKAYIIDFFTVEAWPVGPPWFIWVLFLFNLIFAVCYPFIKKALHIPKLFLTWYIISWLVYVPLAVAINPEAWTGIGPFDFQISRMPLYFWYFLLGVIIGRARDIFANGAAFVKKWPLWLVTSLAVFVLLKLSETPLLAMVERHQLSLLQATLIYRSIWIFSCMMSCIALLTTFKSITNSWWKSLSANAYGIYLVHYIFVIWCQYFLLDFNLPALVKALITFVVAVTLSWWVTSLIRKNSIIKRYL
ncbi:acyltransferase family protein [Chitinophaga sp. SYP-B3965]|uniref:acyltransferase family protein n=1 Tax=Chitinophaga sp. SYP-B3965 TaxID=2663120 RepID=UPI001299F6C6|nr:acyltransferase [Chitinophaga sp. SYP-B3965]MRG44444.1 acyltransferase family protein [Chitinophaga sp. SYP-B3965]